MNLVYQAYGIEDILEQTLFSIVSLMFHTKPESSLQAIIYTDQPEWFQKFFNDSSFVKIIAIDQAQIQKWRGEIDFVHRVKIEVLKDAGQKFEGPIFYCDGDTYFHKDPTPLFEKVDDQTSLMHIKEAELGTQKNPLTKKVYKFVKNNTFTVSGTTVEMNHQTEMWNAGVIGVSKKNKKFFKDILELTDQMHAKYPKHVMEQLAVSYVLQKQTRLLSAEKEIYHYWDQKPEYQLKIQRFFGDYTNINTALKAYSQFEFPVPLQPKVSVLKQAMHKLFSSRP